MDQYFRNFIQYGSNFQRLKNQAENTLNYVEVNFNVV